MMSVRDGNDDAFCRLVDRHRKPILNFVYRFLGNRETAEDVSQDVFVRLWAASRTYVPTARFTTFLYLIARNLCLDHLDKRRRLPPLTSLSQELGAGEGAPRTLEDEIADTRAGPYGEISRRERAAELERALLSLPEDQRLVFVLTEVQGFTYQQAAEVVGCPPGTVASRKSAAVKHLRTRLIPTRVGVEGPG